jgi:hypothetical protein
MPKFPLQGSQNARVLKLLWSEKWVPMYEILNLRPRIAKYTSRISDLRAMGWKIECLCEKLPNYRGRAVVSSSYRLTR